MTIAGGRPYTAGANSGKPFLVGATGFRVHVYGVRYFCSSMLRDALTVLRPHAYTGSAPCDERMRELPTGRDVRVNVLPLQKFHERLVLPTERELQALKRGVHLIGVVVFFEVTELSVSRHRVRVATIPNSNALRVISTANSSFQGVPQGQALLQWCLPFDKFP